MNLSVAEKNGPVAGILCCAGILLFVGGVLKRKSSFLQTATTGNVTGVRYFLAQEQQFTLVPNRVGFQDRCGAHAAHDRGDPMGPGLSTAWDGWTDIQKHFPYLSLLMSVSSVGIDRREITRNPQWTSGLLNANETNTQF